MEPSGNAARVIGRLAAALFVVAVVGYVIGFRSILAAACKPAPGAKFAIIASWLAAFSTGLAAAYALVLRTYKGWLAFAGACLLAACAVVGLMLAALMCSGV